MSLSRVRFHLLAITISTFISGIQTGQAATQQLACESIGTEFQISINDRQMSLLMIQDASSVEQSCQQITKSWSSK